MQDIKRDGYTFDGWFINNATATVSEISKEQTGNITIWANWLKKSDGTNPAGTDTSKFPYLWFGVYPQNDESGTQLEPIKWRVIETEGNESLLLSDMILENVSFDYRTSGVYTWKDTYMRSWLDGTFKPKAFTTAQIDNGIVSKSISTKINKWDSQTTTDKVFLLDGDKAENMGTKDDRKAKGTAFAKGKNSKNGLLNVSRDGYSRWWLRSPKPANSSSQFSLQDIQDVEQNGSISYGVINHNSTGVRPAFYANLNSTIFNNKMVWNGCFSSWSWSKWIW